MPETAVPAVDFSADADLISFLKPPGVLIKGVTSFLKPGVPDGRYRRGVRYPQWYLLLITVSGILSNCSRAA